MKTFDLTPFINCMNDNQVNMFGIAIQQGIDVIARYRWTEDVPHQLFSMSKSYTSMAVGIAISEGCFGLNDRLVDLFPEYTPENVHPYKAATTVRHLLTMSAGHDNPILLGRVAEELVNEGYKGVGDRDWVRAFMSIAPDRAPGEKFVYDNGCTYLLSRLISKYTGQNLLEYLDERLFRYLGIPTPEWDCCPAGYPLGASGLHLRTEDSLAFGRMLLDGGKYNGSQLVPEEWVREATTFKIRTDDAGFFPDKSLGYGYQFWMARHDCYRASGAATQGCFVVPYKDAVICYNADTGKMQLVLEALWDMVIPEL